MLHLDDEAFTYSSDSEWDRADAYQLGAANPDRARVCTDRDVYPFYQGPPQPYPEDEAAYHDEVAHDHYATHDDVTQPPLDLDCPSL
jgi:hypothetical protein